jgi:hypothetical protein
LRILNHANHFLIFQKFTSMNQNLPVVSFLALLLICSKIWAQTPIPNYSFENWTAGEPDDWQTSNGSAIFVTQVTPGHTGTYAAPW